MESKVERELNEALYAMNRVLWAMTDSNAERELYAAATSTRDAIWSIIRAVNPDRKD